MEIIAQTSSIILSQVIIDVVIPKDQNQSFNSNTNVSLAKVMSGIVISQTLNLFV